MQSSDAFEQSLARRDKLTDELKEDPYSIDLRVQRAKEFEFLGYPDLAVMDAYKVLLLIDEVLDDSSEYHEPSMESFRNYLRESASFSSKSSRSEVEDVTAGLQAFGMILDGAENSATSQNLSQYVQTTWRKDILLSISKNLTQIGCLRPAYEYVKEMLRADPNDAQAISAMEKIQSQFESSFSSSDSCPESSQLSSAILPDGGKVRREIYRWNHHEIERHSKEALDLLNREMQQVAPKLEVKVVELPALTSDNSTKPINSGMDTVQQLGVFAKDDISAGEEILDETSLLTGNTRLHEPLCDACSSLLPSLDAVVDSEKAKGDMAESLVPCEDCDDVVFCSSKCYDLAQSLYHPAICGMDMEAITKDVAPSKSADRLYTLLLFRTLAMAQTQNIHPLDLNEVKYIWGDFTPALPFKDQDQQDRFLNAPRTLSFSFDDNIVTPLHMLEMMEVNIFDTSLDLSEVWVWNTLYAKFRGTASARISPRDGRPEVAAVHPLWCLANHSCDPNVQWEWAGQIKFTARKSRIAWSKSVANGTISRTQIARAGGIKKGEEILNHYVDIELPVKDRREWGVGALGGFCMCDRCVWESDVV